MTAPLYILLPVHNRREITRGFVECLVAQTARDYHLLLIDDGSTDGTAEMVRELLPSVTVLRGTGDDWWAGSLQRGVDWLKTRDVSDDTLLLFINDDVRFASDYLDRAVAVMSRKANTLVLSRFVAEPGGVVEETGVAADMRRLSFDLASSAADVNCLSTRGLFAHWGDVKRIGDFHPRLLPHYLSDYEYTMRAHRKGLRCETSGELVIVPNHDTTGFHTIADHDVVAYLRKYFSKRSPGNPVYWSSFILLASSPQWIPRSLARVWVRTFRDVWHLLARRFSAARRPRASDTA